MAQVASPTDLYDFETVIEAAAKQLLTDVGFVAFTSADLAVARPLPRIEVLYTHGDEDNHHEQVGDELLANAWRGSLNLQVIVAADDYATLCLWRAKVRSEVAHWKTKLDTQFPFYSLYWVRGTGASPVFATDKGYLAITLRYLIQFALVNGCLAELSAQESAAK